MNGMIAHEEELAELIQSYHEVTDRLRSSHELLAGEVRRLRDELHEKNRELARRERLAALGEMAAGVAHEIRNPLGGIELYASLLERDLADRPRQREIAAKISAGVRNLEAIVGDILAFAGDGVPKRRRVSAAELVRSVLAHVGPRAHGQGVEFAVDPGLSEQAFSVDSAQMERALLNLVINALDAIGHGGRIWIRASGTNDEERMARLVVEDNGPGIPSELRQRVFHPFFTTKETGTGLGLAIVHRIVEAHGGRITIGQREGGGASFVMVLPMA
jgi:signal transduction histidine kinase